MEWEQENLNSTIQNSQERKMCYKELLDKVEEINEGECSGLQVTQKIGEILTEINALQSNCDLSERIARADETLLDGMVLSSASNVLRKCVTALDCYTSTYEATEFAQKILQLLSHDDNDDEEEDHPNFMELLPYTQKVIPRMPKYRYVYGAYDLNVAPQPKQKKERVKRVKENFTKKQPEKVTELKKDEIAIDEIVKEFREVLVDAYNKNGQQSIKYFDYVVDTSDFGKTVENIFYCSFLVRDGSAHITLDSRGIPFIKPLDPEQLKKYRKDGNENHQMVATITMREWERFEKPGLIQTHRRPTKSSKSK